jgi:hypothetical protein
MSNALATSVRRLKSSPNRRTPVTPSSLMPIFWSNSAWSVAHRFASIAAANGFISTRFRARQGAISSISSIGISSIGTSDARMTQI